MGHPVGTLELGVEKPLVALIPYDGKPVEITVSLRLTFGSPPQLAGLTVTEEIEWFAEEVERIVAKF